MPSPRVTSALQWLDAAQPHTVKHWDAQRLSNPSYPLVPLPLLRVPPHTNGLLPRITANNPVDLVLEEVEAGSIAKAIKDRGE